jgi:Tol biopolymer transport system component
MFSQGFLFGTKVIASPFCMANTDRKVMIPMKIHFRIVSLCFLFLIVLTACTLSVDVEATPSASDQVTTIVAQTLQASTPIVNTTPIHPPQILIVQPLYFLAQDSQSHMQVFRMEQDGLTVTQLTSEPINVLDYDVAPNGDGSLVYEIDNQLILVNGDGSNRRVLVEGSARGNVRGFYHPVFSPDGKMLAYGNGSLILYNVATGESKTAVEYEPGNDTSPHESYLPEKFSPDGSKLLVHMLHADTSSIAMYDLDRQALIQYPGKTDGDFACCGIYSEFNWLLDGSAFYAANPIPGVDVGGLWKVDAATGTATTLVSYGGEGNTLNFVDEPYFMPLDRLYYFYSNYNGDLGPLHRAPEYLDIVRSSPDGVTDRITLVHSERLRMMNEALWVPDAGFVIVTLAPSEDVMDGGQLEMVYFDGKPNRVLAPFAQEIKWGS